MLRRAVGNAAAQLGSQLVTWSATLLFTAALGRYLGDRGLGVLFLALTFTSVVGVLPLLGLQNLITREVARRPEAVSGYVGYGLLVTGALWLLSFVAIQIGAVALGYDALTRQVITIYTLSMGLLSLSNLLTAAFRGLERMGAPALAVVIERVLNMALGIVLLARGAGVEAMAWVFVAGLAANAAWLLLAMRPYLHRPRRLELGVAGRLVRDALPFAAYWIVWMAYWKLDVLLLARLTDETVVGWYGAAYRFFETLLFLPNVIAVSVMLPMLSRLSRHSREAMATAFEKGLMLLLLVGIPIAAAMIVLAGPIIAFVYRRPEFAEAVPVLRVLGVGLLFLYVNAAMNWALVSLDMERRFVLILAGALVVNVALNLILIPPYRQIGAAAATVAAEGLITVVYLVILPKWLLTWRSLAVAARAGLAALGMSAALLLLRGLPLPLLVLIGGSVYAVLIVLVRAVSREDMAALREAVRGRNLPPDPLPEGRGSLTEPTPHETPPPFREGVGG